MKFISRSEENTAKPIPIYRNTFAPTSMKLLKLSSVNITWFCMLNLRSPVSS